MKKIVITILVIFTCCYNIYAQIPKSEQEDFYILQSQDTVFSKRTYGDWWLGFSGGMNTNIFYGDLTIPKNPRIPIDTTNNRLLSFDKKMTFNAYLGLLLEWLPNGKPYGGLLHLGLLDYRSIDGTAINDRDSSQDYKTAVSFNYLSINPYLRYNLPIPNLSIMVGVGFEYLLNSKAQIIHEPLVHDLVRKTFTLGKNPQKQRISYNFGLAYDIYALDIYRRVSVKFSPFITVGIGTPTFESYGGSVLNQLNIKVGVQLKFGPDRVISERTSTFDKNALRKPMDIAQVAPAFKFNLSYRPTNELISYEIDQKFFDVAIAERVHVNIEAKDTVATQVELTGYAPVEKVEDIIEINQPKELYYSPADRVTLDKAKTTELDKFADMLLKDRTLALEVHGFSDNQGTLMENEKRAKDRVDIVRNYLMKSKKIPDLQIYPNSFGSRGENGGSAKYSNATPDGQRKNRRVTLKLVKKVNKK